jgi:hypothetical protein
MDNADGVKTDRQFASDFFNETWSLLDLKERSKEQIERMIHCSHAAFCHLQKVSNLDISYLVKGYWQLCRVYAAAGQGVVARTYGFRCMDEAKASGDPFLMTLACESLGRAAAVLGDGAERDRQASLGKEYAAQILDPDVRAFCEESLAALPRTMDPGPSLPVF